MSLKALLLLVPVCVASVFAQREPVLKQIAAPHPYYYREMYLPQLTTGASSAAWTPDSKALIYSMAGSLWRQAQNSSTAEQLTAGAGYDYQPDCSSDGRWVIYDTYLNDAVELWALDLRDHTSHQLTRNGAVNLEPRFSPDGRHIAFVSTSYNGRFHIFLADFSDGALSNIERLTGENRSPLSRYYYSPFDHEISPVWSRDGKDILFVSNRGHLYGTGGFWRMKAEPGAEAREIHYEETTWKARPDFSPDGKRLVYSSYLGQSWNQLWVMPADGGDAFPLSYGSYDNINPRWSPDGTQIAFISNRGGNTSLWVQQVPGGSQTEIVAGERRYLKPMGHLAIEVLDRSGHPTSGRVFVIASDNRAYAPDDSWMHADDGFTRSERPFEAHYFQTTGKSELTVPAGRVEVQVMKGFEYEVNHSTAAIVANRNSLLTVKLSPLEIPKSSTSQWIGGDVHVHMNYAGAYRNTPEHLVQQAAAENLPIVEDLVVNKEQRIPDISYFRTTPDPASTASTLLVHGQEFHTSYWGHLGLLHPGKNFLLPGYVGYTNTATASLVPDNADVADLAHAQQGLVGYVHPFEAIPDPAKDASLTDELPVDVALGKVDYIEVVGFSDHKSTAEVWYRLLNCGFHLPTAAGTDAMANFASLRGPVGLNRVYAEVPKGPLNHEAWLNSIKRGKTFATNGPLLGFTLDGHEIGDEIKLPAGEHQLKLSAWMRSIVPLDHLELVCNGKVARDIKLSGGRESADVSDTLAISQSGWCVLRAYADKAEYPVLDIYPYATTSPIYISVAGKSELSHEAAGYFVAWIDRLTAAVEQYQDWNNEGEKQHVRSQLAAAREIYIALAK